MSKTGFKLAGTLAVLLLFSQFSYAQFDTWDQYVPFWQQMTGLMTVGGNPYSRWATRFYPGTNRADIYWGDPATWTGSPLTWNDPNVSIEEFEIKTNCDGGNTYVWLDAYANINGGRTTIQTTRAEYVDLTSGQTFDITAGGSCGTAGQPYAIYNVYNSPYILRVWGTLTFTGGQRRFFWQEQITQYQTVTDPCWTGPGSNPRTAIKQDEVWWDSASGWVWGSGALDPVSGEPNGTVDTYGRSLTIAKDAGHNWTYQGILYNGAPDNTVGCLQSAVSWP